MDNCEFYLLYSGGYDSTVLLYDFIDKLPNKLTVIHIVTQYNQEETKAAREIIELVKDKILNYIELYSIQKCSIYIKSTFNLDN